MHTVLEDAAHIFGSPVVLPQVGGATRQLLDFDEGDYIEGLLETAVDRSESQMPPEEGGSSSYYQLAISSPLTSRPEYRVVNVV